MEKPISSSEEARARRSASLDYARGLLTLGETSCSNTCELATRLDPSGSSGRTSREFYPLTEGGLSRPSSKRWLNCGLGGGFCWRVLDAQFFGVAQRRRRVFVVVNTRDWRRAAAVLLERDCLRGDSPSSRDKRKALAGLPGGGAVERRAQAPGEAHVRAGGCGPGPVRGEGAAPGAAYALQVRCGCEGGGKGALLQEDVSATLATSNTQTLFQPTACYSIAGDIARGAHMRQNGKGWSDDGASPTVTTLDVPAVAFTQNQRDEVRLEGCDGQVVGAIAASPGSKNQHYVCMADDAAKSAVDCDMCGTLKRGGLPFVAYRAAERTTSGPCAPGTTRGRVTRT